MKNPFIVQFLHPGREKTGVKKASSPFVSNGLSYDHIRPWGPQSETHGRKFIVNAATYLDGQKSVSNDAIRFWGEAEWDTLCREIAADKSSVLPRYEHIVKGFPQKYQSAVPGRINTDPYVFGNAFKYCCCKQRYHDGRPTKMHDLPEGSIVLFGSYNGNEGIGGFFLDTVFVVDKRLGEYTNGEEMCRRLCKRP